MLRDDIIHGVVDAQMAPMAIYQMRKEYAAFKHENFRNNLKNTFFKCKRALNFC